MSEQSQPHRDEHSQLVINYLKGGALEVHLKEINSQMPYQMVIDKLRVRYNTLHKKLSLESELDSLSFDEFMARH